MSDIDERFARSLHHTSKQVAFGEPFDLSKLRVVPKKDNEEE